MMAAKAMHASVRISVFFIGAFSPKIMYSQKMLLEILDNFGLIFYNFCLCNSTFADKITKKYPNTQKYLHISEKSSTFAPAFGNFGVHNATPPYTNATAIVAQLVEQRIRNAWVAGLEAENWAKMDWIAM